MNRSRLAAWVLTISSLSALCAPPTAAQIVPDATLPVGERSQVTGNPTVQIDGGARRGGNLFHSFSQFSIPTGGSAFFNNATDVQNIFSRVTGGSVSNIDGVLRANGTANLFLLNPNGILFGPNASLNIGGSFVGTTANSINFADNFQYSATNPQSTPLLTVSVPVGLQMGANPGRIGVQGNGYALSVTVPIFSPIVRGSGAAGLRVPVGQTLALLGGDIDIAGATLTAEQGHIELGSVRDGQVYLSPTTSGFAFNYQGIQHFGDVRLSQQALADASGGGMIHVQGNNVLLNNGSLILVQNRGLQSGGQICVNAASSLEASGNNSNGRFAGGFSSETIGVGNGADLTVSARQVSIRDGARIAADSYSFGKAGNVTVKGSNSVQVIGFSPIKPFLSSKISTSAFNSGNAGQVAVSTSRLIAFDGGTVGSSTYGKGDGGDVTVNATASVEVIGVLAANLLPSTLTAITLNSGNAGKLTVNTSRLVVRDGGVVSGSTLAAGKAANVTVNATESIELGGVVPPGSVTPSFIGAAAPLVSEPFQRLFRLPPKPTGASGNVIINTKRLSITDGARVNVRNLGTGEAGTLQINAGSIFLDKEGSITATTTSGNGGDIVLQIRNFLLLRNASQISATAFGNGNGGNIRINAGSIVAVPTENSDIRANSVNARGGNVTINASSIFGIQFRPQDTPLSDITATGASSAQSGVVQLNIQQLDPTSGLVALPTTVVDSSRLIAQGCPANEGSSFVITGRGGLPPTPEQQLDDDAEWSDRRRLTVARQVNSGEGVRSQGSGFDASVQPNGVSMNSEPKTQNSKLKTPSETPILEATGWQITPTGEVFLVATTPDPTVQNPLNQVITCQGRQ